MDLGDMDPQSEPHGRCIARQRMAKTTITFDLNNKQQQYAADNIRDAKPNADDDRVNTILGKMAEEALLEALQKLDIEQADQSHREAENERRKARQVARDEAFPAPVVPDESGLAM